ncbi:phenylacetate-coenzyme A ligase PaaK-like adenylate-forming protein [Alkalibaculum bacchi]|uniref:Phenylacetate-coenzyme A ligase PaaK-like adenylate-forming protein n=1 Tax=Alkalibaculum bacchi TaxID=645887 RepID=A0A366I541_9FIRM|nr:AMP-binding protein [Alkalibaculum bacchi]RBP63359.1 phenylacetate-coenzyme A ligase PaaK-like adenylate-forming protein [Alkalibaculum bacchi]
MKRTSLDSWIKEKIGQVSKEELKIKDLESYQLKRLRETLQYVKEKSKFYNKLLKDVNLEKISSLNDISTLPFTTSEDIKEQGTRFICVSQNEINRIVTLQTSGTTSHPKRIFFTKEDQDLTIDFFHNGMATLVEPGDKVLILMPGQKPGSVGDLLKKGLERLGVESYIYGLVDNVNEVLKIITEKNINSLVGLPQQVFALAKYYKYNKNTDPISLKSILLSADYVPNSIIDELKKVWNCQVYEHYGMTEMGLGGGVACDAFEGYHVREADLYFEVVDPTTRLPVPNGQYGEVVFTTLTRKGMPLIRYLTGDISRIIEEPCPCGSPLKRLDKVLYRIEECIKLESEKILTITQLDEILFSIEEVINYDAYLTKLGNKECLSINISSPFSTGDCLNNAISNKLLSSATFGELIEKKKLVLDIKNKFISLDQSDGMHKRKVKDLRG